MDVDGLMDRVQAHAQATGDLVDTAKHELLHGPGHGIRGSLFFDQVRPVPLASGLNTTAALVVLVLRLYSGAQQEPKDEIDSNLLRAVDRLLSSYNGDFSLGGLIRNIDIMGAHGTPLTARAGWASVGGEAEMRIIDITLPLVINNAWEQDEDAYEVPAELATITAALDAMPSARANLVVVGDSNGEGQGAVVQIHRWVNLLNADLRTYYNVTGSPTPYLPTHFTAATALSPAASTIDTSSPGATTTEDVRYGLGARSRQYARGAFSTWFAYFTSFKVHYAKDGFGVNALVTVDGVSQAAFSCNGTAEGGFVATYTGFAAGWHEVKIQCSDLTLGFIITLEGIEFRLDEETYGLQVFDASRFGATSTTFGAEHAKSIDSISPTAVIYALGVNDAIVVSSATFRTNLTALLTANEAEITAAHDNIIMMHAGRGDGLELESWANYVAAAQQVASDFGAHFVDLREYMNPATNDTEDEYADNVHYSPKGNRKVADTLLSILTRRS